MDNTFHQPKTASTSNPKIEQVKTNHHHYQEETHGVSNNMKERQGKGKEGSDGPRAEKYPNGQQVLTGKLLRNIRG